LDRLPEEARHARQFVDTRFVESQPVGYGAITAATGGDASCAPNPPYGRCAGRLSRDRACNQIDSEGQEAEEEAEPEGFRPQPQP
jgi:hypothetical protein